MQATRSILCTFAASALLSAAQAQTAVSADAPALYHPFVIPAKVAWGAISIDPSSHAWRVGRIDGPPATEAEMRSALADLASIEIGGRCAGWVEGPTLYPCGFAVGAFDLVGAAVDRFSSIAVDWETPDARVAAASTPARPEVSAAGFIAPVLDTPRFVSVKLPLRYLGDRSTSFGGTLGFNFRAVSNALVPSEFDRSSGTVILRTGQGAAQARVSPETPRAGTAWNFSAPDAIASRWTLPLRNRRLRGA